MQIILPKPGTYVVAVSGGVDSMALLNVLHSQNNGQWKLIVAHLDHGIRQDSHIDRQLVRKAADNYRLPFVYKEVQLGSAASEEQARKARYEFLRLIQRTSNAKAIITAHHRDDVLETAVHNIIRGGGRRGMTSLASRPGMERPFLQVPKQVIIAHAQLRGLSWREDSTNQDITYTRNYIRHVILNKFDTQQREMFHNIIVQQRHTNLALDEALQEQLIAHAPHNKIDRKWFVLLPHDIACEIMATWLRGNKVQFDASTIERATITAKVGMPSVLLQLPGSVTLTISRDNLALTTHER